MHSRIAILVIVLCMLAPFSIVSAEWVQDGASLNIDANKSSYESNIAIYNNIPYITWSESNGSKSQIYLKYLNGTNWEQIGGSLNINTNYDGRVPDIAIDNGVVYITWKEQESIGAPMSYAMVKKYYQNHWELIGNTLNTTSAGSLKINVSNNGTPYVAWSESSGSGSKMYVKSYSSGNWNAVGNIANIDTNSWNGGLDIAFANAIPYIAWKEIDPTLTYEHVYVKHFDGINWLQDGGDLNTGNDLYTIYNPAISINAVGASTYVALWICTGTLSNLFVKNYAGNQWQQIGEKLNENSTQSLGFLSMAIYNSTPYVAYMGNTGAGSANQIYVKHFAGNQWVHDGTSLNIDPNHDAERPVIAVSELGMPYVTWVEACGNTITSMQVFVKHWVAPATTATVTPTSQINIGSRKVIAYPNPARAVVHFVWSETQAEKAEIEIYNMAGERITSVIATAPGQGMDWDARGIAPGIYIYKVALSLNGNAKHLFSGKLAIIH